MFKFYEHNECVTIISGVHTWKTHIHGCVYTILFLLCLLHNDLSIYWSFRLILKLLLSEDGTIGFEMYKC